MKRIFILFISMLLLSSLLATEASNNSIGPASMFRRDIANITRYPGLISTYTKNLVVEMRCKNEDEDYSLYGLLPVKDMTVGFYLNRVNIAETLALMETRDLFVDLDKNFSLMFGKNIADFDFGFIGTIAFDKYLKEPYNGLDKHDESLSYFGLGLGASNDVLDVGVNFATSGLDWEESYKDSLYKESDKVESSGTAYGIDVRYFMEMGDFTFVPKVGFYGKPRSVDATYTESDTSGTIYPTEKSETTESETQINLDLGMQYHINETSLILAGVRVFGLSSSTYEYKYKTVYEDTTYTDKYKNEYKTTTLPGFFAGFESKLYSWLTVRAGAAQIFEIDYRKIDSNYYRDEDIETTEYNDTFNYYMGLGFHFKNLTLDAYIDEGIFFDSPYIISGETNALSYQISLRYDF